jgi:DNA modification methylase
MSLEINYINTDVLIPYVNNSRTHSDKQVTEIASSIKEFGFTNPVLIDKENTIIAGHGRLLASKKLGLKEVPTILLENLTEAQKKAYIIADNKLALNAGWDEELLSIELKELDELGYNTSLTGFSDDELSDILDKPITKGLTDEDEVPEDVEPIVEKGDIWQLGNHRLMCGDSTNITDLDKLLNKIKADLVFTDPPYGLDYSGGRTQVVKKKTYGKLLNDNLEDKDLGSLIQFIFSYIKKEADVYVCVSPLFQKPFLDMINELGKKVDAVIVWDKKNAGLGYMKYRRQCEFILYVNGKSFKKGDKSDFDLWSISKDNTKEYKHGTQKPIELIERAINNSSKSEDIVLDLFGGSGSTLLACEKTNRINYSMELDKKYCDVIIKRWENFTGKKAERINNGLSN